MKSLTQLLEQILLDMRIWCSTDTTRDLEEIMRRIEHEGMSFLTITLPTFAKGFERSLELGYCDPSRFVGFERCRRRGPLPRLFSGLVGRVFDSESGLLLTDPCIHAIRAIRQFCSMWKKIRIPCSKERIEDAYARFSETNESCIQFNISMSRGGFSIPSEISGTGACLRSRLPDGRFTTGWKRVKPYEPVRRVSNSSQDHWPVYRDLRSRLSRFKGTADILWCGVLDSTTERLRTYTLLPKHGPGATAERIRGNAKYALKTWYQRLDPWFPACEYAIPNLGYADSLLGLRGASPGAERPVRVVSVPKTQTTPRIIAIEPVCMQYTQQALLRSLVQDLETHPKTSGYVNFTDQTVNQDLALKSSVDGSYATIDLKDASDRVSSGLVWHMLESYPDLRDAIFACRSTRASVPNRGLIALGRFASMGSALCFPIEAMVFYTAVLSGMARHDGVQMTKRRLDGYLGQVFVYGDDLIVPVEYVHTVMDELEGLNLRVNRDKSFLSGKFRESCGVDAYDGEDVTPVYLRSMPPKSRQQVEELESWVSVANQFYEIGYWRASAFIRAYVNRIHTLPIVHRKCSLLGWHSYTHVQEVHRWNRSLQTWETRSLKRWSPKEPSALADMPALMKCLMADERDYLIGSITKPLFEDPEHLQYAGRPRNAYTKTGWALF